MNYLRKLLSEKKSVAIVAAALIVFSLLRGMQGLNVYDDGFVLTAYRQVFSSPGSVSYLFVYYWLIIAGGLWDMLFGGYGIYGFRVLECMLLALNMFLVWRLLRSFMKPSMVIVGFMLIFSMIRFVEVFEYNTFSGFAALLSVNLLVSALNRRSAGLMFVAGTVLGLGFFIRLPNVLLSVLALVFIPYSRYVPSHDGPSALRLFACAVSGCLSGIAVTFCFMLAMGHIPYFVEGVKGMLALSGYDDNTHEAGQMLYVFAGNTVQMCLRFAVMSLCPLLSMMMFRRLRGGMLLRVGCLAIVVLHVVLLFCFNTVPLYVVNALSVSSCLYVIYVKKNEPSVIYTAFLALLVSFLLPLGSDRGILTFGVHSLWLALPFVPYAVSLWLSRFKGTERRHLTVIMSVTLGFVLARGLYDNFRPAYYEKGNRLEDIHSVDYPKINVCTDKDTAAELESLLDAMRAEVQPGDTTLFFGDMPMLYYITDTRPWLRNPWAWIFGYGYCLRQINIARKYGYGLPVVVCTREELYGEDRRSSLFRSFIYDNRYALRHIGKRYVMFIPPENNY